MNKLFGLTMLLSWALTNAFPQNTIKGRVYDAATNEPLLKVSIITTDHQASTLTDKYGNFELLQKTTADSIYVSSVGYHSKKVALLRNTVMNIPLNSTFVNLNEVIVSGNREVQTRKDVPAAIQVISKTMINETKATRLDMLVNKIPGVFMVDLGNEQHSMAVRQPLGYNNLYLYLEDGIPIRTLGDFNHNALIEINQASLQRIEVIKGPASSLYGSEAVGGALNFITQSPSLTPSAKIQAEMGGMGYKRSDFFVSNSYKKLGLYLGGYYANQNQREDQHNDFYKAALTLRADYNFNDQTSLITTVDYINYKTDQKGGLDSLHFYSKDYISSYRFTYRKVNAVRAKSTLTKEWNENNKTSFTAYFRHSSIGQNPFYYIGDVPGNSSKATGQINVDAFNSYGTVVQHVKKISRLKAKWISGLSADISPATYNATFIDVDKNTQGIYYDYTPTDSLLTDYNVNLLNTAVYTQLELNPSKNFKISAAARYDRLDYSFDNHLVPGAYTGAPDTKDHFDHFTPKIGATYDLGNNKGVYANYSAGFAPPNITDLYTGVKVPTLKPSSYNNYEVGGWFAFARNSGYGELSFYQLEGTNEIVNVRLPDGTYQNENAGRTSHKGVEFSVKYSPSESIAIRMGGTYARHKFINYAQEGKDYSGNTMPQAPPYIINSEITYKPLFLRGYRISLEYQALGKYFTDAQNTAKYKGFDVLNVRMGYQVKGFELWANCINLTDAVYATTVEKSAYGTSYRPGQLRTVNVGIGYNFGKNNK